MSDIDEDKPMKALYEHCVTVFEEMQEEAVPEETTQINQAGAAGTPTAGDVQTEANGYLIWTGHTTQVFARLGLATPYYTSVMQALKKMGCVEQVKRGGGNSMSKWRLVRPPEESIFEAAEKLKTPVGGTQKALEQQVRDLNKRVLKLEDWQHDFVQTGEVE